MNGEAIHGTRPWDEGKPAGNTDSGIDVRFTTKGGSLYAILLDWPGTQFTLPHIEADEKTTVELLGRQAPDAIVPWKQTPEGLQVSLPLSGTSAPGWNAVIAIPGDHAFVYRITPIPQWVAKK